ncbi:MAG: phoL [Moraxellaceae bacterium]|jgi:phosphate starvation-inducible PhoH-like protein|nr:phoL [Moraxellaceae bacterium]
MTTPSLNTSPNTRRQLTLEPNDTRRLSELSGQFHEHIKLIEQRLGVAIHSRGNRFRVEGPAGPVNATVGVLETLYAETADREHLDAEAVHMLLATLDDALPETDSDAEVDTALWTKRGAVRARGENQKNYVEALLANDISFGVGPAGTGKTYLAVAAAVHLLEKDEIRRILLVRPAVEAGEKLGFLPGDLTEKINPYLRPLYDALYEMLGFERVAKLIEKQVIEVAPLAYMRGRTLNNAFIILDEGQNTTPEQMKMFLTRLGFGSKAVITGDITQVDLPRGQESGLAHALRVLKDVKGIHITRFTSRDVVRHRLVQFIVEAYEAFDSAKKRPVRPDQPVDRHRAAVAPDLAADTGIGDDAPDGAPEA